MNDFFEDFGFKQIEKEDNLCPKCQRDLPFDGAMNDLGYCEICYGDYEMEQDELEEDDGTC